MAHYTLIHRYTVSNNLENNSNNMGKVTHPVMTQQDTEHFSQHEATN